MKKYFLLFFIPLLISACSKNELADLNEYENANAQDDVLSMASSVAVKIAGKYNKLFTRYGNGWTGGDATYSVPLPDGRILWMFGDSFLDTVYADRSRPASALVRNVFVVQQGLTVTTLVSGTLDDPEAFVNTPDPANAWYWPLDGTVQGDYLYVYMAYFIRTGPGGFDFAYQRTDLVKFSLPAITEISRTTVWDNPNIMYGAAVMEYGDYLYIYGAEFSPLTKYMHLARVPLTDLYASWEFYNGSIWQSTEAGVAGRLKKSSGLPVDVSAQFAVFYNSGYYRLVTQEGFLGPKIYTYYATAPTGPWKSKTLLYTTPETSGSIFTYNAFVHPEIISPDGYILLSYNLNTTNFAELFSNADSYRPKFIWMKYL